MADEVIVEESTVETTTVANDGKPIVVKIEVPKVEVNKSYSSVETQKLIDEAIQAGQKIAKGQLYPEIQKLKDKVSVLDSTMHGQVSQEELAKLATEKAETVQKLGALEEAYVDTRKQIDGLTTQLHEEKLETYKQKKIAGADGKIIPELVVGNSQEEIDTSIEKAKVKYSEIQEELRKKYNLPTEVVPKKESEEEEKISIPRINKKTDLSKWSQEREKYLKDVYGKYNIQV